MEALIGNRPFEEKAVTFEVEDDKAGVVQTDKEPTASTTDLDSQEQFAPAETTVVNTAANEQNIVATPELHTATDTTEKPSEA